MDIPSRELTPEDLELIEFAREIVDANTDGEHGVHTMGAAVRGVDGKIYGGINLYHFTGGPCAELVALGHARASGARELAAIVAVGNCGRGPVGPCGRDRQILLDYHPGIRVILPTHDGVRSVSIADLMPLGAVWTPDGGTQDFAPFADANAGDQPIRKATVADLPSIQKIITEAYARYLPRMDRPPAPMLRDYTPAVSEGSVWVTGHPVRGLITLTPAGDSLLIENLAVHPSAQGAGLGRRLMDFAELQAARLKLARLRLYTNEVMTENLAIYVHLGYREIGRLVEDGYRRVYMEKILNSGPVTPESNSPGI